MPKLLGEFLQEQQEPFALEVYLVERGTNLNARQYDVVSCSNYLKSVFSQLVMATSIEKNSRSGCRKKDRFPSVSSSTSFTYGDAGPAQAQYDIDKRSFLIDCVKEVIGKHRIKDNSREEELWKLVCEDVWIHYLLRSDFLGSEERWNADFEQQRLRICKEIENAILEGFIDEIVSVIIKSF